jgi:hypothetical protein
MLVLMAGGGLAFDFVVFEREQIAVFDDARVVMSGQVRVVVMRRFVVAVVIVATVATR